MTGTKTAAQKTAQSVGHHLREWRQRRRLSQLALAGDAEISTKHLSFLETGRALPSREMVLRLAERLDLPLRERNVLLVAAGYAPVFPQRDLGDSAMTAVRAAVDQVIAGHEPYPALAIDRHWNLVAANNAVTRLIADVDAALLQPPVNVLRLSLHPDGLAPRIVNYREWRAHLLARLRRQIDLSADPVLVALLQELEAYRAPANVTPGPQLVREAELVVPFRLVVDGAVLSFISTTTVFGTPVDVTLSELAIESFFPADAQTADRLRGLAPASRPA